MAQDFQARAREQINRARGMPPVTLADAVPGAIMAQLSAIREKLAAPVAPVSRPRGDKDKTGVPMSATAAALKAELRDITALKRPVTAQAPVSPVPVPEPVAPPPVAPPDEPEEEPVPIQHVEAVAEEPDNSWLPPPMVDPPTKIDQVRALKTPPRKAAAPKRKHRATRPETVAKAKAPPPPLPPSLKVAPLPAGLKVPNANAVSAAAEKLFDLLSPGTPTLSHTELRPVPPETPVPPAPPTPSINITPGGTPVAVAADPMVDMVGSLTLKIVALGHQIEALGYQVEGLGTQIGGLRTQLGRKDMDEKTVDAMQIVAEWLSRQ
jgi:hypothetical protein